MVTLTIVLTAVVGAAVRLGMAAALMDISDDCAPKPTRFRAVTLKV